MENVIFCAVITKNGLLTPLPNFSQMYKLNLCVEKFLWGHEVVHNCFSPYCIVVLEVSYFILPPEYQVDNDTFS